MAIYLQVRAGSVLLLVDALAVHEVLELDRQHQGAGSHCEWRKDVLQTVNLGDFFGSPSAQALMGVVYTPNQQARPLMLQVNEVIRLRDLRPSDWSALPRLPLQTQVFFDAIHVDRITQDQIYRLRNVLDARLFDAMPDDPSEAAAGSENELAQAPAPLLSDGMP